MKKALVTILISGFLIVSVLNVPALAAIDEPNTTDKNIVTADMQQINEGYSNIQLINTDKISLLTMIYKAKDGETLATIADKFNANIDVLKFLNQLKDEEVQPGQQIIIAIPQNDTLSESIAPTTTVTKMDMPTDPNPRKLDSNIKNFKQQDLDLLAKVVYSEARGESFKGQVAVASVVLNRTHNPLFPKTLAGVIFEPWAFTAVNDGQFNLTPNDSAYIAAKEAMRGFDPSDGALYYWNPLTATSKWIWSRTVLDKIGNHLFAK